MRAEVCSKCGAAMIRGQLGIKGSLWELGFKPDSGGLFAGERDVYASACPACGYIELRMAEADSGQTSTITGG